MPISMRRFEFFMYLFIASLLGMLVVSYAPLGSAITIIPISLLLTQLSQLLLVALLTYLVARRRYGWVRWIIAAIIIYCAAIYLDYALVFFRGYVFGDTPLSFLPGYILAAFAVATLQFVASVMALFYGFNSESSAWLKRP